MTQRPVVDVVMKDKRYGRHIPAPRVDGELCTGCGRCAKVCPSLVFEIEGKRSIVSYGDSCIACGHCWAVCPERAVTQRDATSKDVQDFSPEPLISAEDFLLFLKGRRSVRQFESRSIPREQLERVVDAGRHAPTGTNSQNVEYVVLSNPESVEALRTRIEAFLQRLFKKLENPLVAKLFEWKRGPVALYGMRHFAELFRYALANGRKSPYFPLPFGAAVIITHTASADPMGVFNGVAALHNCALAAHAEGLGSCYLGFAITGINMDKSLKAWLGIPKNHTCHGSMVLGYPAVKYRRPVERLQPRVRWM